MSQCFLKLYERSGENIQVELGLSNYATKVDLKGGTGADTSNLVVKSDLASLKAEVNKIDIGKLKTAPADLSELSKNVVDNDVVQKLSMVNKSLRLMNAIDTSGFALKTQYNTDISGLEKKINDADKKSTWYWWTC